MKGFIPTGWYPTSVAVTPDGKNLLVGVGKGNQTQANPIEPIASDVEQACRPKPPEKELPADSPTSAQRSRVHCRSCRFPTRRSWPPTPRRFIATAPTPMSCSRPPRPTERPRFPIKVGDPSPIKHVIYIIKENRTYDQVFGDMPRGNGDPALTMFGEQVTPNHHKLAREFVLLDNLYCNGHVSADGHPWSTMAYNTDYIARTGR